MRPACAAACDVTVGSVALGAGAGGRLVQVLVTSLDPK